MENSFGLRTTISKMTSELGCHSVVIPVRTQTYFCEKKNSLFNMVSAMKVHTTVF